MLAFLPASKDRNNKFYIFRRCTYIVYLLWLTEPQLNITVLFWEAKIESYYERTKIYDLTEF